MAQGLKFFYRVTLKRPEAQFGIPTARQPQKLPQILAREEVARLIERTAAPEAPGDPDDHLRRGAAAQ